MHKLSKNKVLIYLFKTDISEIQLVVSEETYDSSSDNFNEFLNFLNNDSNNTHVYQDTQLDDKNQD